MNYEQLKVMYEVCIVIARFIIAKKYRVSNLDTFKRGRGILLINYNMLELHCCARSACVRVRVCNVIICLYCAIIITG